MQSPTARAETARIRGSERVRAPRLLLTGEIREAALIAIAEAKMSHAPI